MSSVMVQGTFIYRVRITTQDTAKGMYVTAGDWLSMLTDGWISTYRDNDADLSLELYAPAVVDNTDVQGCRTLTYPAGLIKGNGETIGHIRELLQTVDPASRPEQIGSVQFFPMGFTESVADSLNHKAEG